MSVVNHILGAVVGALLAPLRPFPAVVGVAAMALIAAVAALLVVRAISDQSSLARVKRQMHAGLLEIRLFNDDPMLVMGAMTRVLRGNISYLRLLLLSAVCVTLPLLLLLIQLQFYYGYDGLAVGAEAVVKVRLDPAAKQPDGGAPDISLLAPPGLRVDERFVWIPSAREAAWRLVSEQRGDYELVITVNGRAATKAVRVSHEVGWRSPARVDQGFLDELLSPVERPISDDAGPVSSIHVTYPERRLTVLGFSTHWTIPFLLASVLFTFALRKPLGVVL